MIVPLLFGVATYLFFRKFVTDRQRVNLLTLLTGNGLLFLVLATLLLLALESYYRFCYDTTDGGNFSKVSKRWFRRHWIRNQEAVRDNVEYTMAKCENKRRITFLGDSFTAGHGVADVDTRFVNRIRSARQDWEVHTYAALGLSTYAELMLLYDLADRGYEFDVVVLVYCYNDLDVFIPEIQQIYRVALRPPQHLRSLIEHSYCINVYFHRWKERKSMVTSDNSDYFSLVEQGYSGDPWKHQQLILRRIKWTVERRGGRFIVVTFPLLINLAKGKDETHIMHRKLGAVCRELKVPHLDLLPLFQQHKGSQLVVNRYDDHPSTYAHGLATDAILRFIEDYATDATQENAYSEELSCSHVAMDLGMYARQAPSTLCSS